MKTKLLSAILIALVCISCEPKERLNVNNPVCCMLDSVSVHYYLTTRKNVLTTTFRQGETMIVHYDLCNISLIQDVFIFSKLSNPYINALHGKCYSVSGENIEHMSFTPSSQRVDQDWTRPPGMSPVAPNLIDLRPKAYRSYKNEVEIDLPQGEYYYETTPVISFMDESQELYEDTINIQSSNPLRIYFTVE